MTPDEMVEAIAGYAAGAKAGDVVALDLRGVLGYTDFFLVCHRQHRPPDEGDPRSASTRG